MAAFCDRCVALLAYDKDVCRGFDGVVGDGDVWVWFDPGLVLRQRVDRSGLVMVRMAKYSVPARLIGRQVRVALRASEVVVFDGHAEAARHERDHYLGVLRHKPGALRGSTSLAAARQAGVFTAAHEAFWQTRKSTVRS